MAERSPHRFASKTEEGRQAQLANLGRSNGRPPSHGAYARIAEDELEGKCAEIFDALAADAPVRAADGGLPAHDAVVVRMLAENLVRRQRILVDEFRHGIEIESGPNKGRLRGVVEYGLQLDRQALEMARELGMTPAARAKLGLDLARAARTFEEDAADAAAKWGDVVEGTAADAAS